MTCHSVIIDIFSTDTWPLFCCVSAIQPRQLLFWSGEKTRLSCNFSQTGTNASVSDFSFYSSSPGINKNLITEVINSSTIRTNVLVVDRNMSSENISCRFRNETLDEVTLHVAGMFYYRFWELYMSYLTVHNIGDFCCSHATNIQRIVQWISRSK